MDKWFFLIILLGIVIYANSVSNPFIWDDIPLIVENPYIKNLSNLPKIFSSDIFSFSYYKGNYYRPLQTLTYIFDYGLGKLNPIGYHISNILLHSTCAILVYLLALYITANKSLSLISSLLFLVNPIHTEAVTYISGRADSLVTMFFLLSLLFYIKFRSSPHLKRYYIFSLLGLTFALLSKEIALTLPFIIILYDSYFSLNRKVTLMQRVFSYLPYLLILGLYAVLRMTVLNFSSRQLINIQTDFILRLVTSIKAVIIYIGLILFPLNLHMERTLPRINSLGDPTAIISLILLVSIIILTIRLRKSDKLISFGSAWFLLNLIPVSSIFMPTRGIVMAEHWLYLPSIGFFVVLGGAFDKLMKLNKRATVTIVISLLLFYVYLTIRQNTTWKDPLEFYRRTVLFSPHSAKAHFNLGFIYEENMEDSKAIEQYKRVLEIDPHYFLAYNNIGNIYAAKGQYIMAMAEYKRCLEREPNHFLAYNNLGNLYALNREYDKAIEEYKKSIILNPYYSQSRNNLGLIYLEEGSYAQAEAEFKQALRLNPENAEAHSNLGNLYFHKGLNKEAVIQYQYAIELKPNFDRAYFNLGVVYFKIGLVDEAKKEWQKALDINPHHSGALRNLELLNQNRKYEGNGSILEGERQKTNDKRRRGDVPQRDTLRR